MAMQGTAQASEQGATSGGSFIYDPKVRSIAFQIILVVLLVWFGYAIYQNTVYNLTRLNISSGFGFLNNTAGFGIIGSPIEYSESSTYGRALLAGLINTAIVAFVGIILATIIGFIVGVARLSKNWVISKIATVYVETLRNIPLLLQIFFWYFAVLRALPGKRDKVSLLDTFHLNIAGAHVPKPIFADGAGLVGISLLAGLAGAIIVSSWAQKRQMATGQQFPVFKAALGMIVGLPLLAYFVMGMPISLEHPNFVTEGPVLRRGFEQGVGLTLISEFLALLLALSLYTAAFIAEIVRAGILAVSHGQTEAASALGLRPNPTLRLVVIPQAMRVIIPPLTSQYLNLTKNSSLAVAIAYQDLVAVGGTTLNQTGQAVEIVMIWMFVYLSFSIVTSLFMNWYNKRMALVER